MELIKKLAEKRLPCVLGEGPKDAKLVFLGEALGEKEALKLRPFVGDAGWLFDDILRTAGVPRSECYVMNVIPTRPPENKVSRLSELGITLEECEEWARQYIAIELKPTVIVALGAVPLKCLTGLSGITEWRGSVLSRAYLNQGVPSGIKVIPTFHPSYVRRLSDKSAKKEREGKGSIKYTYGSARLTTTMDIRRAWNEAKSTQWNVPSREYIVSPCIEQVEAFLAEASTKPMVAFDVETKGKWIDCVGFAFDKKSAICIPRGEQYWKSDTSKVENLLRKFFWEHEGLVAQNGSFDLTMLLGNFLPVRKLWLDTMAAHHFLYPELPHDLHYLASIYTMEPYYKWRLQAAQKEEERWLYNCIDNAVTLEIAEALVSELYEFKVEKEFFGFVMKLFHTVLKMGLRGVRADLAFQTRLRVVLEYLIKRRERQCRASLGVDSNFNLNSHVQLKNLLYTEQRLPTQYERKSRKPTVNEEALLKLSKLPGQAKLGTLLAVRDVQKAKSTYADVPVSFDGRLRTVYSVTGTGTGRLNSKQDYFDEGWNSQNPPKWFRKIVLPELEEVLLEADLKFAEALLIAWFAQDRATIEAVRQRGEDIYRWHGGRMLGKAPDQITKEERDMVKPVVLGCGYGLGSLHMHQMLAFKEKRTPDGRVILVPTGITAAKAKDLRNLFFKSCPAILEYQEKVREMLHTTRTLVTPFNRRRIFLGRFNEEMYRIGYAFFPQSSCVDYLNRGMIRVDCRLPGRLRLQVHDAMVLSVPETMVEEAKHVIVEELAVPVVIHGEPLVIPVELKMSSKNWGKMEDVGVFNILGG
jgi:DNA polymerase